MVIRTRNHNVDVTTLPADSPLINTQPSQLPQKFILIVPTGKVIAGSPVLSTAAHFRTQGQSKSNATLLAYWASLDTDWV